MLYCLLSRTESTVAGASSNTLNLAENTSELAAGRLPTRQRKNLYSFIATTCSVTVPFACFDVRFKGIGKKFFPSVLATALSGFAEPTINIVLAGTGSVASNFVSAALELLV
ncbi:MAG: hypothetical protein ABI905_14315 [Betaproteobacteria bacterium]